MLRYFLFIFNKVLKRKVMHFVMTFFKCHDFIELFLIFDEITLYDKKETFDSIRA